MSDYLIPGINVDCSRKILLDYVSYGDFILRKLYIVSKAFCKIFKRKHMDCEVLSNGLIKYSFPDELAVSTYNVSKIPVSQMKGFDILVVNVRDHDEFVQKRQFFFYNGKILPMTTNQLKRSGITMDKLPTPSYWNDIDDAPAFCTCLDNRPGYINSIYLWKIYEIIIDDKKYAYVCDSIREEIYYRFVSCDKILNAATSELLKNFFKDTFASLESNGLIVNGGILMEPKTIPR